jgi:hypothetical protein
MSMTSPGGGYGGYGGYGGPFNPFLALFNRTRGNNGGMFSEQRKMQFEVGMAHLQHQLGEESADNQLVRQQQLYSHQQEVDHGNAKDMETHKAQIASAAKWEDVEVENKKAKNAVNVSLDEARRRNKLPLNREDAADRRLEREKLKAGVRKAELDVQRSESVTQRDQQEFDFKREQAEQERRDNAPMVNMVMDLLKSQMGGGAAPGTPAQGRTTMPRYGSAQGRNGNKVAPRRVRQKRKGQ